MVTSFTGGGKQPVMVQKFLENVYKGDKRVMMLGDKFLGAAMRRPKQGYHANFASSDALKDGTHRKRAKNHCRGGSLVAETWHPFYRTGSDR